MDIAAVASFAVLFLAWIVAPDRPRRAPRTTSSLETTPIPA